MFTIATVNDLNICIETIFVFVEVLAIASKVDKAEYLPENNLTL
jgi:hypothetical protein